MGVITTAEGREPYVDAIADSLLDNAIVVVAYSPPLQNPELFPKDANGRSAFGSEGFFDLYLKYGLDYMVTERRLCGEVPDDFFFYGGPAALTDVGENYPSFIRNAPSKWLLIMKACSHEDNDITGLSNQVFENKLIREKGLFVPVTNGLPMCFDRSDSRIYNHMIEISALEVADIESIAKSLCGVSSREISINAIIDSLRLKTDLGLNVLEAIRKKTGYVSASK